MSALDGWALLDPCREPNVRRGANELEARLEDGSSGVGDEGIASVGVERMPGMGREVGPVVERGGGTPEARPGAEGLGPDRDCAGLFRNGANPDARPGAVEDGF